MINASYGGQTYNDVESLVATDGTNTATVTLSESGTIPTPTGTKVITSNGTNIDVLNYAKVDVSVSGGGGDVGGLTEYHTQTTVLTQENVADSGTYNGVKIAHGLSKAPAIIRMVLDYSGNLEDNKQKVFIFIGFAEADNKDFGIAVCSNATTGDLTGLYACPETNPLTGYAMFKCDSTYVYISKPNNANNFDTVNSYTIECWA